MKLNVTKTIGKRKYPFQFEGKTFFDVVLESSQLSFPDIDKCGLCGSDDLMLDAYTTVDDNNYVKIVCNKCRGNLTFGQKKKGNIFYYRRTEEGKLDWSKYEKKASK